MEWRLETGKKIAAEFAEKMERAANFSEMSMALQCFVVQVNKTHVFTDSDLLDMVERSILQQGKRLPNDKSGPRFKKGDTVRILGTENRPIGTILRTPKRRSTGILYEGQYAYDVELPGKAPYVTRWPEHFLSFADVAAQAGK
jgi:hypothetical protein